MTTNKRVHLSYFIQYTKLVINAGSDKKNQLKERLLEKVDHSPVPSQGPVSLCPHGNWRSRFNFFCGFIICSCARLERYFSANPVDGVFQLSCHAFMQRWPCLCSIKLKTVMVFHTARVKIWTLAAKNLASSLFLPPNFWAARRLNFRTVKMFPCERKT